MSEKTENQSNPLDMLKWVVVFALLAGIVTANSMYGNDVSVLYRAIAAVVTVVVAGFIAATTEKGAAFLSFAKESRIEVRKVIWPTRQEANQTTLIVLAATLVMALILWGLDGIIVRVVGFVMSIGA
ncbi:preprotein translocase subunit SecE [Alteromonas sp. KUL49]|uniref:preprotein translocase subunit SecE n=1 Tax=Alteromonas sp. KUL49 TaxID=2480798 RepID=UPI00102EFE7D|nr:preprotein translocase subunit SecE [Alteromonas sp. KUL49]TAP42450.1 preprotein translocase subunit SecE [Alteromonas sp. KUL49]GEA10072.1 protein translocase subunit SecE [Alteromonas sp. KUL49]